ncbi:MAG: cache domain-containing protein [Phycisphaerae bacterium]|nr:cache domain-containing protein [Phycisphaerae bacterium]
MCRQIELKNNQHKYSISEKRVALHSIASHTIIIFLPIAIFLCAVFGAFYRINVKAEHKIIESTEPKIVQLQRDAIASNLESIVSDLMVLSQHSELERFLDGHKEVKDELADEFIVFSKEKKCYDQVRYLDETGMEVVRINFNEGKPSRTPDEKLQSKKNRYYFSDAFALDQRGIFISPLDLNIERGEIERPLMTNALPDKESFDSIWIQDKDGNYAKPMMRFATPVFNKQGEKKGVVLLNYFGSQLINIVTVHSNDWYC